MRRLRASLTATTVSTMRMGAPTCSAVRASASVSFGKQEPPKPGPGCRNLRPMRPSRPMPRATSCTSAPTASQRSAISLMKVILVARKALAAYLIELGRLQAGEEDRRFDQIERPVELAHHLPRAVALGADDDAVGAHEIVDRRALAQELRIGDDVEVGLRVGLADDARDLAAGADRHRRLGDDDGVARERVRRSRAPPHRHRSDRRGRRRAGSACRRR